MFKIGWHLSISKGLYSAAETAKSIDTNTFQYFAHAAYTMNLASKKDRHEVIGEGFLGIETISNIINHPKLKNLVFNLETPNEVEGHKKEIAMLRDVYK